MIADKATANLAIRSDLFQSVPNCAWKPYWLIFLYEMQAVAFDLVRRRIQHQTNEGRTTFSFPSMI